MSTATQRLYDTPSVDKMLHKRFSTGLCGIIIGATQVTGQNTQHTDIPYNQHFPLQQH